jgi:5-methylcytosine-specific restriction protein A
MGERVNSQRSNWGDLEIDFESTGVAVDIRVDGFPFDMGAMVPSPWKSLEIESRKRLPRRADFDEVVDAWSSVAGASLCLVLSALSIDFPPEYPDGLIEGARITVQSTRSERNPVNRYRSIQHYGRTCWACDIDFAAVYGELGGDFIEVHHIFPLAGLENPRPVDPIREMVPLCSNCHSMAHRLSPPVHPIRLREILNLEPKESIFLEL